MNWRDDKATEMLIRNLLSDISWLEQGSSYERDICKNIYKALAIIEPNKIKLKCLISEYHLDERLQTENEKDYQTHYGLKGSANGTTGSKYY